MTRRAFLQRAAILGLAVPATGALLEACLAAPPASESGGPRPSFGRAGLPEIIPLPRAASYGDVAPVSGLAFASDLPSSVRTVAAEIGVAVGLSTAFETAAPAGFAAVRVANDATDLPPQGYRLAVTAGGRSGGRGPDPGRPDAPGIEIHARDDDGAFWALQSVGQLVAQAEGRSWIRTASVTDHPAFARRGFILDTPQPPSQADRDHLLDRVRASVQYKMNLLTLPEGPGHSQPSRALIDYCTGHHVELLCMVGYRNWLTTASRIEVDGYVRDLILRGIRSFTFNWDDIRTDDPTRLAADHGRVLERLYELVRSVDPAIRVSVTLPPYGGVPGKALIFSDPGMGEAYLALMRDRIPSDVEVFWTGDDGGMSKAVTAEAARAYGAAVGHAVALWDNDTIHFAMERLPVSGRAADLADVIGTYMGNVTSPYPWRGDDDLLTMITALDYTWNPAAYDAVASGARAAARLGTGSPGHTLPPASPFDLPTATAGYSI
jgi:beta-N-acetylglucosaminidase/Glycosyl hydrolase family 20, domain 2